MFVKIYKIYVSICNHLTLSTKYLNNSSAIDVCIWVNNENDQTLLIAYKLEDCNHKP